MASTYLMRIERTDSIDAPLAVLYADSTDILLEDAALLPPNRKFTIEFRNSNRPLFTGNIDASGMMHYQTVTG